MWRLSLAGSEASCDVATLSMRISLLLLGCALVGFCAAPILHAQSSGLTGINDTPVAVGRMEVTGRSVVQPAGHVSRVAFPRDVSADVAALSDALAGFHIAASGAHSFNDTHALRGLVNTPIFGGPAVAVYLDEMPVLGPAGFPGDQQLFGGASLYRGPAASGNFGYAGSAGVLVLHSPLATKPVFSAGLTAGDHGLRAGMLGFDWVSDTGASVAGRFSAMEREGYLYNRHSGTEIDQRENLAALLRIKTRPFPRLSMAMTFHATRARDGEQPLSSLDGPLRTVERTHEGFTEHEALNAAWSGTWETQRGHLSGTVALNHWDLGPYRSVLSFGSMELINDAEIRQRNRSVELRYVSREYATAGWTLTALAARAETTGGFTRAMGGFVLEESRYKTVDKPVTLSVGAWWRPVPRWTVSAGVRGERNERSFDRVEIVPAEAMLALAADDTAFLPRAELSHDIDSRTRWTLSASVGRKPGGFSAFTGSPALAAFGAERNRALETSIERGFPATRLTATLSAYTYFISGYQIERSFSTGASTDDYLVVNAPKARSIGGEAGVVWLATDALTLRADLGGGRIVLRSFTDPFSGTNYSGRRAPYAPAYDATLSAICRMPRGFEAMLAVNSAGRVYFTEGEEARFSQASVTRVNASIGWRSGGWCARLLVRNLTDRDYYSAIAPGTGHGTPGAPRTVMMTIEWAGEPR